MYTEETASPGLWKSEIVGAVGIALIGAAFVIEPGTPVAYLNWALGLVAGNIGIALAGNRKWERPLAGAAGIWLFMSGFVPSLIAGPWMRTHQIAIGVVLVACALSAHLHLRDDIRHHRALTM